MKIRKKKHWFAGCLIIVLMLICSLTVLADERKFQLSIEYQHDIGAVAGAKFNIFRVGELSADGRLSLTGEYAKFPVKVDVALGSELQTAADTLLGYIEKEKMKADHVVVTDSRGKASVSNLEQGLYLVVCPAYWYEKQIFTTQPQLIVLPQDEKDHVVLDVKASVEYIRDGVTSVKVLKDWNDQTNSSARPKTVTVHLLKDGKVFDTVELMKENNWRYVWQELNINAQWSVVEEPVKDYLVTVEKTGNTFLVTNTSEKPPKEDPKDDPDDDDDDDPVKPTKPGTDPTDPSGESGVSEDSTEREAYSDDDEEDFFLMVLPQTGMVWWPVVLMIFAGMVCIVSGIVLCRRGKHE